MGFFRRIKDWLAASIDSRLVGSLLRWSGFLSHPLDDRLRPGEAIARAWRRPIYRGIGWPSVFGPASLFLIFVLAGTGILLSFHYEPHPETSRASVLDLSSDLPAGWLIRGSHHWAAQILVVLVAVHALRAFWTRAYRAPRQANWIIGLLIFPLVLSLHFTGTLLPWDQQAFWGAAKSLRLGSGLPIIGAFLGHVADGSELSNITLGRAHALHVVLLPWTLFFLLTLHLRLIWRHGLTPPMPPPAGDPANETLMAVMRVDATSSEVATLRQLVEADGASLRQAELEGRAVFHVENCRASLAERLSRDPRVKEVIAVAPGPKGRTFFPDHFLRLITVNLLLAAALVMLSAWMPPPIGPAADPFHPEAAPHQPWYVLWAQGLSRLGSGLPALAVPFLMFLLVVLAFAWPLIDAHQDGRPRHRLLAPIAGLIVLLGLVALSIHGAGLQ